MTRQRVIVLTTGGTIASTPGGNGRNVSGAMSGESLLERVAVPQTSDLEVEVRSILQKPSNAISLDDLVTLSRQCQALEQEPDVIGIVITHGTDTLEETAHFLDITLSLDACALVMTGSQRAPHEEGTDAFRNLANAITVAADPRARGLGVAVVFNESIFAARSVRKLNSYRVNGFGAPDAGALGYVDGQRVHLAQLPRRSAPLSLGDRLPRIDILASYLDASPQLIEAAVASGAQALVIEGLGRGHVPPTWLETIGEVTRGGIPIAVVSVCHEGPVNTRYEFPGSLASLQAHGAIPVSDLSARKARLTLAVLLSSVGPEGVAARFEQTMS
ncbi:asparaginase [Halomonas sp. CKK8]|uniref:asparaginase n=1 Tax=Halomonas sp. CKK8 TaxID=3036127 RepID=UPI0024157D41|nr:asparaginase [Halomonas sp. CKK8]WFM69846.1 asparaginase [Halomonas sp. CKK8]